MAGAAARCQLARAAGWALLTAGWIVLASLSDRLAPGPWHHAGLLGAWLLAPAGAAAVLRRAAPAGAGRLLLALASAGLAARSLSLALDGAGWWALWPALPGWALLVALASAPCRGRADTDRAPLLAAAAGALLAWAALGDPTDLPALLPRATLLLAGAALLLGAAGPPRPAAAPGWAGLPGCLAAAAGCAGLACPRPWPLRLAALAMLPMLPMLPMMAGLPQMLALCRADTAGPQMLLGLHLAAMFLPGLCMPRLAPEPAARLCLWLLAAGAAAAAWLPGSAGAMGLGLALGAAWSLAWAAHAPVSSAPRQHVAEHLEALPGGLGR